MPRTLTNFEFFDFQREVDLSIYPIPPWGMVLNWRDMDILVYEAFNGDLFLTDITDIREQIEIAPPWEYDPDGALAFWRLPEETAARIWELIGQAGTILKTVPVILGIVFGLMLWREVR